MQTPTVRKKSALLFVLKGLIPYSQENVMLAFKPNRFFNDLEAMSNYTKPTLERALREAERQNLIKHEARLIKLTDEGQRLIRPFVAQHLPNQAQLMIIFDIPETMAVARAQLRRVLRSWHFHQIQKSVWVTPYDHRQSLKELVAELELVPYIQIYECAPV
jgi:DNA-binding MarR family transcriptional regulator